MVKSFFHEGKLISIEVELKYSKIEKEELAKPQFLHRIKGFVNDKMVRCIDTGSKNIEYEIERIESACKTAEIRARKKIDVLVRKLIELGFK